MDEKEYIDYLYRSGKLPSRYYYQLNGKSIEENWRLQHKEIIKKYLNEKEIKKDLQEVIGEALSDVFERFKTAQN